jgi:hypothetical protein
MASSSSAKVCRKFSLHRWSWRTTRKKTLQAATLGAVGTISRMNAKPSAEIALERRAQRAWTYFCGLESQWDKQASTGRSELFP